MKSEYLIINEIKESYLGISVCLVAALFFFFKRAHLKKKTLESNVDGENLGIAIFLSLALLGVMTDTVPYLKMRKNYKEVIGMITNSYWEGGKKQVDYSYEYCGFTYKSSGDILKFNGAQPKESIRKGDRFIVVIDSLNPKRSLIDLHRKIKSIDN